MTLFDRAAHHPHLSIVLEVIEGLDPEPRQDHGSQSQSDRGQTADAVNDDLKHDLGKNGFPHPVLDRPAAQTTFFQGIRFGLLAFDGGAPDGLGSKAVKGLTASCRVAVINGADIDMVTDDVADVARAVKVADLGEMADKTRQGAALMVKLMRCGNKRHDRHPAEGKNRARHLQTGKVVVGNMPSHDQVKRRTRHGAKPDRDVGQCLAGHAPRGKVQWQQAIHDGQSGECGHAQPDVIATQQEARNRHNLHQERYVVFRVVSHDLSCLIFIRWQLSSAHPLYKFQRLHWAYSAIFLPIDMLAYCLTSFKP